MRLSACLSLSLFAIPFGECFADQRGSPVLVVPLRILDDSPYLKVQINESAPLWFILDSGASACVLDKSYCEKVGIPFKGKRQGTGAGAGSVDFFFIENIRFAISGLTMKFDQAYGIDLAGAGTPKEVKLVGILGYDFFRRWIVVIDYPHASLTLYDPKTFTYDGKGESLPLVFKKKTPFVKGSIQVPGHSPKSDREWLVDTGSSDTLNDDLLAATTGPKKRLMGGHGLGQEFPIWQATADEIRLGQLRFSSVVGYSGGMKIGGGLLRQFKVIFDYPGSRMILEPAGS
jgi:hypothetical protein